ncbi:MAG: hypothetical protein A3I66_22850 [Burkholderiales bacterium RIFCSPLOWO2_02_FULL_57_36]|nr:MAG: hypothetical protein A3I66_22850 [Burkholderiales bacterium RIFCSPLOWO2_02_FULL_57_36]
MLRPILITGLNIVSNAQDRPGKHVKAAPLPSCCACTCPVCGNNYFADPVRLKHGRQSTCSRACSYKLRVSLRTAPFFTKSHKATI